MALGTEGALVAEGAVGSSPIFVFVAVPFKGVIFSIMRTWWGTFVALVAIVALVATAANLRSVHRWLAVFNSKALRVGHLYPVTILTTISSMTRCAPTVRRLELFPVFFHELWGVVTWLDIF